MAKKALTQSTVSTTNIQNQQDRVTGKATELKKSFDQYGIDSKVYNNTVLLAELADETDGNSGSNTTGHKSDSITANNVGDALEENRVVSDGNKDDIETINTNKPDTSAVVLKTGNQSVDGIKTFVKSPIIPTPTTDYQVATKKYVDDADGGNVKTTGNQSIAGIKAFSSSPTVPETPTSDAQVASKGYVDTEIAGVILGQIPDNSLAEIKMAADMKKQAGGVAEYDTVATLNSEVTTLDDTVNNTAEATESNIQSIASITPEVSSNAKVEMNGLSVVNSVENSDFSDSAVGWSPVGGSITVSNNILSITGDGGDLAPRIYTSLNTKVDEKWFGYAKAKVDNLVATNIYLRLGNSSSDNVSVITSPNQDEWYELYGIITKTSDDVFMNIYQSYVDAATANGKVMEVDGTVGVKAINLSNGISDWLDAHGYTTDEQQEVFLAEMCRKGVIDGLQGIVNIWLKTVGKNLFDVNQAKRGYYSSSTGAFVESLLHWSSEKIPAYDGIYLIEDFGTPIIGGEGYSLWDSDKNWISSIAAKQADITGLGASYITFSFRRNDALTYSFDDLLKSQVMLVREAVVPNAYEPFKSASHLVNEIFHSLPNLVSDKLIVEKSGAVKKVKNVNEYVLESGDIIALYEGHVNVDRIKIHLSTFSNVKAQTVSLQGSFTIIGFSPEVNVGDPDYVTSEYKYGTDVTALYLYIPKGTYADLAATQADLAGTKIIYELETPITEDLGVGALSMFKDYTQISVESGKMYEKANALGDTAVYYVNDTTRAGSELNDKAYSIDKITKITFDAVGNETQINDTSNWTIDSTNAYGLQRAHIPQADYDTSATYYVEYKMLYGGSHGELIDVTYQRNIQDALDTVVQSVSETNSELNDFEQQQNMKNIDVEKNRVDLLPRFTRTSKDSDGIFVIIEWKEDDGTIRKRSTLSGGTAPEYTTRTVQYYSKSSELLETIVTTLSYDSDSDVISEV